MEELDKESQIVVWDKLSEQEKLLLIQAFDLLRNWRESLTLKQIKTVPVRHNEMGSNQEII